VSDNHFTEKFGLLDCGPTMYIKQS